MDQNNGPSLWRAVFSDQALIQAVFGAMGGSARSLALRTTWKEGLRLSALGGLVSFGAGTAAPVLLKPYFGAVDTAGSVAIGTLTMTSFLVGVLAVTIMGRMADMTAESDGKDGKQAEEDEK